MRGFGRYSREMTESIEIATDERLGRISLNRPEAINALNLEMIETITAALLSWREDAQISAVLVDGHGPKGFCAGGDVRAVRAHVLAGTPELADAYFAAEYRMNGLIAAYPKPLIAVTHGVVMGGGIGIAGHCGFRITQPGARFAMPESAIGFFGDVGVNAILAAAPLNRALLFLMTGASVGAADALSLGLADAVVDPGRLMEIRRGAGDRGDVGEPRKRDRDGDAGGINCRGRGRVLCACRPAAADGAGGPAGVRAPGRGDRGAGQTLGSAGDAQPQFTDARSFIRSWRPVG